MLLGANPLRLFNLHNRGGINKIRGNLFEIPLPGEDEEKIYNVLPSIDPGFFAYSSDPKLELRILEDYRKALMISQDVKTTNKDFRPDYTLIDSLDKLDEFVQECHERKFVAFDTESRSLPWSQEPLTTFSFCTGEKDIYVLPVYQHDPNGTDWKLKKFWDPATYEHVKAKVATVLENPDIAKSAHNIKYDMNVIWKHTGIEVVGFLYDSMLLHHALNEQKPHALEYLADVEYGVGNYSEELHKIIGVSKKLKSTYDNIPDHILWPYAAADAWCVFKLTKLYLGRMNQKPHLWKLYCDEIEPLIHTLTDAERHGHPIDYDCLWELKEDYQKTGEELLVQMRGLTWDDFNPMSTNHVREALLQMGS